MTELPGLLRTLGHTVKMAVRSDPKIAFGGLTLIPLGWAAGTLFGLWLKLLIDSVVADDTTLIVVAVGLLVVNQTGASLLGIFGRRLNQTLQDRASVHLEHRLIGVSAGTDSIEHLERPDYLDRLDPLRQEAWIVHWTLESLAEALGAFAQTALTVALLASVHPALLLLPLFGIPALLVARRSSLREKRAEEQAAAHRRRQRHLVQLGTDAAPGKEIRVFGLGQELLRLSREEWQREHRIRARVAWQGTGWQAAASAFFAVGFVLALLLVARSVASGAASAGDLALTLVLARTMSQNLGLTIGMTRWLVACLATGQRYVWLVDRYRAERDRTAGRHAVVPAPLRHGIELRGVTFRYPGTDRVILRDVSLALPAGAVIALVGENGAGKTTLVKLLCGMYEPTGGEIRIDGTTLADLDLREWRRHCTGAFQDYARFELTVREAITIGDLDRHDDRGAALRALTEAGAEELRDLLDTQLGTTWPGGTELSGGQWQKLALARSLMRPDPLLTVLDEPTANLDAPTEDELFARYADVSRRPGGVTLLVSHRFSTVRTADLIVVLDSGRIREQGSHAELMRRRGGYAELYELQARGYR